jgi:hypothetical protein
MKKLSYLLLLILLPTLCFAKTIPTSTLEQYAIRAIQQKGLDIGNCIIKEKQYIADGIDTLIAIYTFNNSGFIVMSADDHAIPVLAYSIENNIDFNNLPPAFTYWIDSYKNQIVEAKRENLLPSEEIINQWDNLILNESKNTTTVVIEPLIRSNWDQNKYYNQLSPVDNDSPTGYDNRVPVGCVALAMSTIMYYYRYPATGQGTHTNYSDYGNYTVNFAQQVYDYDAMQDELSHYNGEVAKLIFHCATSVDMSYAADGSGAYSFDVPAAMKNNFKYASTTTLLDRSSYNSSNWLTQIKNQLNSKKPIFYSGTSTEGGHAFVCDGYDSDDLCHFNFGWSGYGNGYFTVGTTTTSVGGYYSDQSIIINCVPATYPTISNSTTMINSVSGTLEDGSRINNYADNLDFTYIIAPQNATQFSITLQTIKSELGIDTLSFWKGNPSNGLLVGSYSGDLSNISINISTDSLYITFKSNGSINDQGWRLKYNVTTSTEGCSQVQIFTTAASTISDGSPIGSPYLPESECIFLIRPTGAQSITITFNRFDLNAEDNVEIYDITTSVRKHLNTYTGSTLPATKTYAIKKIQVNFKTDNKTEKDGFELSYTINNSIDESTKTNFIIFPNPAQNFVTVMLEDDPITPVTLLIFDAFGKQVKSIQLSTKESNIDISCLTSGLYLLRVDAANNTHTQKLIKN